MKVVAVVQARMGSSRLPGKVLREISGQPLISVLMKRMAQSLRLHELVVAIPEGPADDVLARFLDANGYKVFRGSEGDVLKRYFDAAKEHQADVVVRVTGDCPFIDPAVLDTVIDTFVSCAADYASNIAPPTFPDGLDVEVFGFSALQRAHLEATELAHREHVTPYLRESGLFKTINVSNEYDHSSERWTVDEVGDLQVADAVLAHLGPDIDFTWQDILQLKIDRPELFQLNSGIARNEGLTMRSGQKLWKRAKDVIPGGNMLLSKRAEMFLPGQWPAYFSKAKGHTVWDLDGNMYIDTFLFGVGTNTLGYGHPEVDAAVLAVIADGNMSTLNAPEEVYLAERLIHIHPWADMARFCRSGGEANAVAIRIARAASGRDKVAFCGYHGWHDWYLAANLGNDRVLAGHLLPGLEPRGVPQELRGSICPFSYNSIAEFDEAVSDPEVGVIFMEVSRNSGPQEGFLEHVRDVASQKNLVLIFDECTSGFRQSFGGLHKIYGVEPDMATFGKTIGNGYAITAVIGRRAIMEAAQSTFISSTFWTERIGSAAALKTLEVMERERSWEVITATGLDIRRRWQQLADDYRLVIDHWGLPSLCGFTVRSDNALAYKTLITQEMLAKGYLAGNSIYSSIVHTPDVIETFFEKLAPVFRLIKECEDGRNVVDLLNGPVAHGGFKRLN
ncbi:glutamate-1-semialdehyde aminotransferase [Rhizobium leguminosarum bv. trifolii WSM2297]|uniref:Glutamate-1-semialdehyde aminotransferase n=1 Tax=Rhizobium leguminosarum bv. trifolii WSM2297 TaxID=754762 RepID=J0KY45_RHILT|nr:aminotransferase class III-fold pyridoxal phosphate-dependent enzyme [Rhizobium leguminosarum]EJC82694.1 glutamate-1-semialdehyde aminotransferase [Rhizobium leguminosarum bv. trifolii WSM2297]